MKTLIVQSKHYLIKRRTEQFLEKYFENDCNATEAVMQILNKKLLTNLYHMVRDGYKIEE